MAEPAAAFVRLEVDGGVGTIRLDRPPVNAMSFALLDQLRAIATEASDRTDVRAVVLFGGDRAFAAGADINELAVTTADEMVTRSGQMQAAFTAVAQIAKPVVAAVIGPALGGGCELALAADVRFCADDAVLGQPEILLGVLPGGGGTQRLTAVGRTFAGEGTHLHRAAHQGRRSDGVGAGRPGHARGRCLPGRGRLGRRIRERAGGRVGGGEAGNRRRCRTST